VPVIGDDDPGTKCAVTTERSIRATLISSARRSVSALARARNRILGHEAAVETERKSYCFPCARVPCADATFPPSHLPRPPIQHQQRIGRARRSAAVMPNLRRRPRGSRTTSIARGLHYCGCCCGCDAARAKQQRVLSDGRSVDPTKGPLSRVSAPASARQRSEQIGLAAVTLMSTCRATLITEVRQTARAVRRISSDAAAWSELMPGRPPSDVPGRILVLEALTRR
jgi:hypothetical protein